MQGPDDRNMMTLDIVEQGRIMQVIAVDVVQMDDIRLKSIYLFEEIKGGTSRIESLTVEEPAEHHMAIEVERTANPDEPACTPRPRCDQVPGIGDDTLATGIQDLLADALHNHSCSPNMETHIDLQYFHHILMRA